MALKQVSLRDARKARNLTQRNLGLLAKVSQGQISYLETYASSPSHDTVKRLARVLRVHPNALTFDGLSQ